MSSIASALAMLLGEASRWNAPQTAVGLNQLRNQLREVHRSQVWTIVLLAALLAYAMPLLGVSLLLFVLLEAARLCWLSKPFARSA